jgi:hypothetical protein
MFAKWLMASGETGSLPADVGLFLEERKKSMFELVMEIVRAILVALTILVPLLIL